jgi:hypothetical protein
MGLFREIYVLLYSYFTTALAVVFMLNYPAGLFLFSRRGGSRRPKSRETYPGIPERTANRCERSEATRGPSTVGYGLKIF